MPKGKPNATPEERFLKRVIRTPCKFPDIGECHIWNGGAYTNGYGQVKKQTYNTYFAHQYACHRWNNSPLPVEPGMEVSHRCDTRLCVNPAHLVYQTKALNMEDMNERNPRAFNRDAPTEAQVNLLKELLALETPKREIARQLNHSRSWIERVVRDYI